MCAQVGLKIKKKTGCYYSKRVAVGFLTNWGERGCRGDGPHKKKRTQQKGGHLARKTCEHRTVGKRAQTFTTQLCMIRGTHVWGRYDFSSQRSTGGGGGGGGGGEKKVKIHKDFHKIRKSRRKKKTGQTTRWKRRLGGNFVRIPPSEKVYTTGADKCENGQGREKAKGGRAPPPQNRARTAKRKKAHSA